MAEYTVTVRQGGKSFPLRSDGERSLLDCLRDAGFTGIHAPCGGQGTCRQCTVSATGPLRRIADGEVFTRGEVTVWKCNNCGHIHIGKEAPEVCPVCAHPKAYFQLKAENY